MPLRSRRPPAIDAPHGLRPADGVPAAAAAVLAVADRPLAALVLLATLVVADRVGRDADAAAALPLGRFALPAARIAAALAVVALATRAGVGAPVPAPLLLGSALVAAVLTAGAAAVRRPGRVLVLGTPAERHELAAALRETGTRRWVVVDPVAPPVRGADLVAHADVDLVVHTGGIRDTVRAEGGAPGGAGPRRPTFVHRDRFCELALGVVPLDGVDDAWLATAGRRPDAAGKRATDVVVGGLLLLLALPVLALLAPLIAAESRGGVVFRQWRVGRDGRPFSILKLRTMRGTGSDWSGRDDPRVTRLGRLLRASHADELPQLWNVVRGDMSLVGPRPEQVTITALLGDELPLFSQRSLVRPGITGWARVRAGYAATTEASALKLGNDLFYVRHRSWALDVAILLETLRVVLFERQYEVEPRAASLILGRPPAAAAVPAAASSGAADARVPVAA